MNITFIIYLISLFIIFVGSLIIFYSCLKRLLNKNTSNINKFKITNIYFTCFILLAYSSIFIIFFYYIRLKNIHQSFDINILLIFIKHFFEIFLFPLNYYLKIFIIILTIIIFLDFLILVLLLFKFLLLEIFKLYLYLLFLFYKDKVDNELQEVKRQYLSEIHTTDIISYLFCKLLTKFTKNYKKPLVTLFIYNEKYQLFIKISPFFVILYDIIFNNLIIINFYYYMLIYVPVMLLKKITIAINKTNYSFAEILWDIYYNNNNNILFIANKEQKEIIDILLNTNVGYDFSFAIGFEFFLQKAITFTLVDSINNIYCNSDGIYLQIKDNKIFESLWDDDGFLLEDEHGNQVFKESTDYTFIK